MLPYHHQETEYTCGAASMRMIFENLGIKKTEKQMVKLLGTNKVRGTWEKEFPKLAEKYKFTYIVERKGTIKDLKKYLKEGFKIIICYDVVYEGVGHYAILKNINSKTVVLTDPWYGKDHEYKINYFKKIWKTPNEHDLRWFFGIKKNK